MKDPVAQVEDRFQLVTYGKFPLVIERGEDVWIETAAGERYLDLYGGHAVALTGHCHPRLVKAIREQAGRLLFYSNAVYNPQRASAAEAVVEIAPSGLDRVFFVNSGAEANENALKLARKVTGKSDIISFEGSFHGRTIGALSATGMAKYREAFRPLVPGHKFVAFGDMEALDAAFDQDTAGVILEPIQSMAGVRMCDAAFYRFVRELCDRWKSILIYDEVQTGFGRTGEYFFASRYGVVPDIITAAKGVASGLPAGLVLVGEKIAGSVGLGDLGSTFGGGPLVCVALEETVRILSQERLLENVREQSEYLFREAERSEWVEEVLGLGFLLGLRLETEARRLQQFLLKRRILTGLSADPRVLRLLPPLTLKKKEIDHFLEALRDWKGELDDSC